jgi:hypothetical protein
MWTSSSWTSSATSARSATNLCRLTFPDLSPSPSFFLSSLFSSSPLAAVPDSTAYKVGGSLRLSFCVVAWSSVSAFFPFPLFLWRSTYFMPCRMVFLDVAVSLHSPPLRVMLSFSVLSNSLSFSLSDRVHHSLGLSAPFQGRPRGIALSSHHGRRGFVHTRGICSALCIIASQPPAEERRIRMMASSFCLRGLLLGPTATSVQVLRALKKNKKKKKKKNCPLVPCCTLR